MKYFHIPNNQLETAIDCFFQELETINQKRYKGALSILLLGSLSRGEATWICEEDGRFTLLSDIEFFTFYPKEFSDFEFFDSVIKHEASLIESKMGSSLFHVDNTWIAKEKIRKLERKLLVFDAQEMGITVIGEDIKKYLPSINIRNVNLEDISDIIIHRVFSVLYYGKNMAHTNDCFEYKYLLAKNSLDLMTVLLVENGKLISGFGNRMQAVEKLQIDPDYIKYFQYCLLIKMGTKTLESIPIEEMESTFIRLCEELSTEFAIPITNKILNMRAILRRHAGMIKRALISRHLPCTRANHLRNMICIFTQKRKIDNTTIKDNFVLNGYPSINLK